MPSKVSFRRGRQILAWAIASVFILGFFFSPVGAWTGAIIGVWFVGTQRPRRGFIWQTAFVFVPMLTTNWRKLPLSSPLQSIDDVGWMLLVGLVLTLPLLFHRLVSPNLPGFLSTLPYPLASVVIQTLALLWIPSQVFKLCSLTLGQSLPLISAALGTGAAIFLVHWFASTLLWMWNHEFQTSEVAAGTSVFALVFALSAGYDFSHLSATARIPNAILPWICLVAAIAFSIWAALRARNSRETWAHRKQTISVLQSPYTGSTLQLVGDKNEKALVSTSGERFPIRNGIPVFLRTQDLIGPNRKYNELYETIGGFYDDTQRVWCGLSGMDRDTYVMSYLGLLEIKPGDSVLETSVGTGLNFKYLPRNIKRIGLDISAEMLTNCQKNMRRWKMDADLLLGNAESLPFADSSIDVVFHTGGINFFSDRAKAIREMIRVAKPGSLILIADETEEHVKSAFETFPVTGAYYKDRSNKVIAPIDLVPPEMQDIRLESIWNGRFYALTFRKPTDSSKRSTTEASSLTPAQATH